MDEIEVLKHTLGSSAKEYNDTQLRLLSRELDLMADFLLDLYLCKRNGKQETKLSNFDNSDAKPVA
jgi:hypothetical protein